MYGVNLHTTGENLRHTYDIISFSLENKTLFKYISFYHTPIHSCLLCMEIKQWAIYLSSRLIRQAFWTWLMVQYMLEQNKFLKLGLFMSK